MLPLDSGKASYERLAWTTEKGNALAVLKGIEDKAYKDKLYSLVAFSGFDGGQPARVAYDPAGDKSFPAGMSISPDRSPAWMEDLAAVTFGIRPLKKKTDDKAAAKADAKPSDDKAEKTEAKDKPEADKAEPDSEEKPDLVLWHYQDKRLQSQQQVEEDRDKRFSFVSLYRTKEGKFVRLADDDGPRRHDYEPQPLGDRERQRRLRAHGRHGRPALPGHLRDRPLDRRAKARDPQGAVVLGRLARRQPPALLRGRALLRVRRRVREGGQHHGRPARVVRGRARRPQRRQAAHRRRSAG